MKLRRLTIHRLVGIDDGFKLEALGDGLNIVVGPNGIGKSSLCRAVRALFWGGPTAQQVSVAASFHLDGDLWLAERDFSRLRWQRNGLDVEPPDFPPAHLAGCFFLGLRDLLEPEGDAGRGVATEVRRQMSGGFDLREISESLSNRLSPRWGRKEQKQVELARREVLKSVKKQDELGDKEDSLKDLIAKQRECEQAGRQLPHVERAIELAELRGKAVRVTEELKKLPSELEKLTGNEQQALDALGSEISERSNDVSQAQDAKIRALCQIDSLPLAEPLAEQLIQTLSRRADALVTLEGKLTDARADHSAKKVVLDEATNTVGGFTDAPPDLDLPKAGELFDYLRRAQNLTSNIEVLEQRKALLEQRTFADSDRKRKELLRLGIESLRSWLRAPDYKSLGGATRNLGVAALLFIGLGTLGALLEQPLSWLAVAFGMGLAISYFFLRMSFASANVRETTQQEFPTKLETPFDWTVPSVKESLRKFESEFTRLDAAEQRARDRQVEAAPLESQLASVLRDKEGIENRRTELARRLELKTIPLDAELIDIVRAVDELRKAQMAERECAERVASLQKRYSRDFEKLSQELLAKGTEKPEDAPSVRAAVDTLRVWDQQLRRAQLNRDVAERDLERLAQEISRLEGKADTVFLDAGVKAGDRSGLMHRLNSLPPYRNLCTQRKSLNWSINSAERGLFEVGQEALASAGPEKLAEIKSNLVKLVDQLEATQNKIATIEAEVRHTRAGHEIENLLAEHATALHTLSAKREQALYASAGKFLIKNVHAEQKQSQMPDVLNRARELFADFTHHQWELRFVSEDDSTFLAEEVATQRVRNLEQLSDGTRAQLFVAARLAFAEEAERGTRLPLFLDEALDQCDPARFHAIARSLGRIVHDDNRQIFYLTSDPSEVQRFTAAFKDEGCSPPCVIDLAKIREQATAIRVADVKVALPQKVPLPGNATAEQYAEVLGVSQFDPRRSHHSQHIFHVTWDDLTLLHRLVTTGIRRVGQWCFLWTRGTRRCATITEGSVVGKQLNDRIELLENFIRFWRVGRGRPVDRGVLEESGLVTERFLDVVVEIAASVDGNVEQLLDKLRERSDERLYRFRSGVVDRLEKFFEEQEYLDRNTILEEDEIVAHLQTTPVTNRLPDELVRNCLYRWWRLAGRN